MRFDVLGPLVVHNGRAPLDLRTNMLRRLFAALLANRNDSVQVPSLIDALWPADPPANAAKTVQIYVHRLRRKLAETGDPDRIVRQPSGYAVVVHPGELDADEFVERIRAAGAERSQGRALEAEQHLTCALGLWRGQPFGELADCTFAQPHVHKLTELRVGAVEERGSILLEQGRHAELLSDLPALVEEFPYREGLSALQMMVSYRSGRPAEAEGVYRRIRETLAEDLGVEPGAELRRLYSRIRRRDPGLERRASRPAERKPGALVQLPRRLETFIGRDSELATLSALAQAPTGTVVVSTIDGMGGIGKTTLAIQAGHRLARHFPDGQIFLDLHGLTDGVTPLSPATALDRLLRTVGVSGAMVPRDVDERAALWRSSLTGRRVLLILDNAAGERQVRPLLPGSGGCVVLVTSRRRLSGLEDVHPLTLTQLSWPDARALLAQVAAPRSLAGEPGELVDELIRLSGGLPLALRLAAARLRDRPRWPLADLVSRMRDEQRKLSELNAGERGVSGVFELSYRQLPAVQQRLFRLLGMHPGADFDAHAVAALAGTQPRDVRRDLEALVDAHLLQSRACDRYVYHDLLRTYAADKVRSDEPAAERRAAAHRLLGYYLDSVLNAMDVYSPQERETRPRPPASGCTARSFDSYEAALRWLDTERPNLVATTYLADEAGRPGYVGLLSELLARYLGHQSHHADAQVLHGQALDIARASVDRAGEACALKNLGAVFATTGPNAKALDCFAEALTLYEQLDEARAQADVKRRLGQVLGWMGRLAEAYDLCTQAAEHYRAHDRGGDLLGEVRALRDLGVVCRLAGKPEEALSHYDRGLELARESGDLVNEASLLGGVAAVQHSLGRFDDAVDCWQWVLRMREKTGFRDGAMSTHANLGNTLRELGRHDEALDQLRQALATARLIGSTNGECDALRGLGYTLIAMGRAAEAIPPLDRALELARQRGHPSKAAYAHEAMGRAHRALGDPRQAAEHEELARSLRQAQG